MPQMDKRELLDALDRSFGNEDAQELVFELGLDWHNLPGESKRARLRALIEECLRSGRLGDLIAAASVRRPAAIPPGTTLVDPDRARPQDEEPPKSRARPLTWMSGIALVLVAVLVALQLGRFRPPTEATSTPPESGAALSPSPSSPAAVIAEPPPPTPTPAARAAPTDGAACPAPAAPPQNLEVMLSVTGTADFLIGDDRSPSTNGKPLAYVTVTAFLMDAYEVTYRQYREFISATGHLPPEDWSEDFLRGKEYQPVTGVSWQDAADYCAWVGRRLPTQEEWELACRGAVEKRLYPWGDDWDTCRANTLERGLASSWHVGSYAFGAASAASGDSPYGASDMVGNAAEWTSSAQDGPDRVVRGGSWTDDRQHASCVDRTHADPELGYPEIGFRCARDAP